MKKNDGTNEPRDEFDHVMLPAFLAKPLSFLQSSPDVAVPRERPAAEPSRRDGNPNSGNPFSNPSRSDPYASRDSGASGTDPYDPDSYRSGAGSDDTPRYDADHDEAEAEAAKQAGPVKWWAGSRGRLLIYVGSAVLWIFIQSRN
jgi:hypothetical protein